MNIAKPPEVPTEKKKRKKKGHLHAETRPKTPKHPGPKTLHPQTTSPKILPSKTACSKLKPVAPPRVLRYLGGWWHPPITGERPSLEWPGNFVAKNTGPSMMGMKLPE